MLSDDDIQRVAIQCGMKSGQHWNKGRMNTSKMRSFARAIEREVRKQVLEDAAHPDAVEALRDLLPLAEAFTRKAVFTAQRAGELASILDRARAVLAAQGGDR